MRRVLTTLMILLVVLVAGLSALVLLVNPNDFRAYMVRQVEARSGYQLKLDGPLRWHVWPQLSILWPHVVNRAGRGTAAGLCGQHASRCGADPAHLPSAAG